VNREPLTVSQILTTINYQLHLSFRANARNLIGVRLQVVRDASAELSMTGGDGSKETVHRKW